MDPVIATIRSLDSYQLDDQPEFEPERELASSIRRHFGALADVLHRMADLLGDTEEGIRLRAAASAAKRGLASADRVYAKIDADAEPVAIRRQG